MWWAGIWVRLFNPNGGPPQWVRLSEWLGLSFGDDMRETAFKVLTQGDVEMAHDVGYMVVGGDDAVCFFIDPKGRAFVDASTTSQAGCPVVFIATDGAAMSTEIEFSEFPGWRFHAGGAGKSIAIALVRCGSEA